MEVLVCASLGHLVNSLNCYQKLTSPHAIQHRGTENTEVVVTEFQGTRFLCALRASVFMSLCNSLRYSFSNLQRPPFTIFSLNVLIRLGTVGDLQVLRVPLELLARAVRNRAQQDGFGQRP